VWGKVNELNAEADLKSVIAHNPSRTDLVAVGETKTQRDSRSGNRGNVALDEDALGGQVDYPAVTAISIHFAAGP